MYYAILYACYEVTRTVDKISGEAMVSLATLPLSRVNHANSSTYQSGPLVSTDCEGLVGSEISYVHIRIMLDRSRNIVV